MNKTIFSFSHPLQKSKTFALHIHASEMQWKSFGISLLWNLSNLIETWSSSWNCPIGQLNVTKATLLRFWLHIAFPGKKKHQHQNIFFLKKWMSTEFFFDNFIYNVHSDYHTTLVSPSTLFLSSSIQVFLHAWLLLWRPTELIKDHLRDYGFVTVCRKLVDSSLDTQLKSVTTPLPRPPVANRSVGRDKAL